MARQHIQLLLLCTVISTNAIYKEEWRRAVRPEKHKKPDARQVTITDKRILCFGDSLTEGYYNKGQALHPYNIKLSELLNNGIPAGWHYTLFNVGVRAHCVATDMTERLPGLLDTHMPLDLVIILGGTNDLNEPDCPHGQDLFNNIKNLHDMCHQRGVKTVAITIPEANHPSMKHRAYNHQKWLDTNVHIRNYAQENPDMVIPCDLAKEFPLESLADDVRDALWDDNIHFTVQGYNRMGEIIYNCIKGKV